MNTDAAYAPSPAPAPPWPPGAAAVSSEAPPPRLVRAASGWSDVQLLTVLRALAVGGQTLALLAAHRWPHNPVALFALATGVAPFAIASLLALVRARRHGRLGNDAFFRQILTDLIVLTLLIGVSGGPDNPCLHLFFLPLVVAAATLPATLVWRTTAFGVTCYVLVVSLHLPLPGNPGDLLQTLELARWLEHGLLAVALSYFVLHMSKAMRLREDELATLRERETRAGCAIMLGSVAAGAAHELGTPLSTIATELGELRATRAGDPELQRSVAAMQASVRACLQSLQSLRLTGSTWLGGQQSMNVDELVERVVERFLSMRPGTQVELCFDALRPGPRVQPDMGLQQAIINLLSNAAYVSPQQVRITAGWSARELRLCVVDHGPGVSPEIEARLGQEVVSSKPPGEGRGVGLFLSQVTVTRLGGRLTLANAPGGGAVAEISIPLEALKVKEKVDG